MNNTSLKIGILDSGLGIHFIFPSKEYDKLPIIFIYFLDSIIISIKDKEKIKKLLSEISIFTKLLGVLMEKKDYEKINSLYKDFLYEPFFLDTENAGKSTEQITLNLNRLDGDFVLNIDYGLKENTYNHIENILINIAKTLILYSFESQKNTDCIIYAAVASEYYSINKIPTMWERGIGPIKIEKTIKEVNKDI